MSDFQGRELELDRYSILQAPSISSSCHHEDQIAISGECSTQRHTANIERQNQVLYPPTVLSKSQERFSSPNRREMWVPSITLEASASPILVTATQLLSTQSFSSSGPPLASTRFNSAQHGREQGIRTFQLPRSRTGQSPHRYQQGRLNRSKRKHTTFSKIRDMPSPDSSSFALAPLVGMTPLHPISDEHKKSIISHDKCDGVAIHSPSIDAKAPKTMPSMDFDCYEPPSRCCRRCGAIWSPPFRQFYDDMHSIRQLTTPREMNSRVDNLLMHIRRWGHHRELDYQDWVDRHCVVSENQPLISPRTQWSTQNLERLRKKRKSKLDHVQLDD